MSRFIEEVVGGEGALESPGAHERLLRVVAGVLEDNRRTDARDVQLARRLAAAINDAAPDFNSSDEDGEQRSASETRITIRFPGKGRFEAASAIRLRQLGAWVTGLQREFFGRAEPPCKTEGDALAWVEENLRTRSGRQSWGTMLYDQELSGLLERVEEMTGVQLDRMHLLDHPVEVPGRGPINVSPDGTYYPLIVELVRMSLGSRFPVWDLLLHTLAGTRPRLEGVSAVVEEPSLPSYVVAGEEASAPRVVVTFDGPVTHDELRQLHGPLKDAWSRSTHADPDWVLLKTLVAEAAGDGPIRHSIPFFREKVLPLWLAAGMEAVEPGALLQRHYQRMKG